MSKERYNWQSTGWILTAGNSTLLIASAQEDTGNGYSTNTVLSQTYTFCTSIFKYALHKGATSVLHVSQQSTILRQGFAVLIQHITLHFHISMPMISNSILPILYGPLYISYSLMAGLLI